MARIAIAGEILALATAITCIGRAEDIRPLVFWAARGGPSDTAADRAPLDPLLLGSSFGGKWLDQNATEPLVTAGARYHLYALSGRVGIVAGGAPRSAGGACDSQTVIPFPRAARANRTVLGLAASWNAMPRRVSAERDRAGQRDAVAELLRAQGIRDPDVRVTQALRVDLDGDGRAEFLVSATRYSNLGPPPAEPAPPDWQRGPLAGDYSVVILRKLREGSLQTTLLAGEVYRARKQGAAPRTFEVVGVLDANGDGSMEIAVGGTYDGGGGIALFALSGSDPKVVLGAFCGPPAK
jgi:hypothetical protein